MSSRRSRRSWRASETAMIEELITGLTRARVEIDYLQLAEVLWLAQYLPASTLRGKKDHDQPAHEPGIKVTPSPGSPSTEDADDARGRERSAAHAEDQGRGDGVDLGLYISSGLHAKDSSLMPASAIRVPAATPLPASLQVGRALKPLKRRYQSRVSFVFDDEATVHKYGESGILSPVMRPAWERWFDLVRIPTKPATHSDRSRPPCRSVATSRAHG